jgi:hypothetical protein
VSVAAEDDYIRRKDEKFDVVVLCEEFFSFSVMFLKVYGGLDIYNYSPRQGRRLDIYYNNHIPQRI